MTHEGRQSLVAAATRFRERRRMRRRRKLTLVAAAVVIVAVLATGAWVALASSALALRQVTVEGVSRLTVADVVRAARLSPGTSLLRIDPDVVASRVERLPAVARAVVSRSWPHRLVISVEERRPAGVVLVGGRAILLDRTGVAFASQASAPPTLVRVTVGAAVPGPGNDDAHAAMTVLAELPRALRSRVVQLDAPSPEDVSFVLRDGRVVVWGSAQHGRRKATVLRALLRRAAHRYDVSAPDVAVTS